MIEDIVIIYYKIKNYVYFVKILYYGIKLKGRCYFVIWNSIVCDIKICWYNIKFNWYFR